MPPGWLLQVSSLAPAHPPAEVAGWVRSACAATPGKHPTLVLQDVTDPAGDLATGYLDALAPYLPGGRHACVGRLFVGTVEPHWTGSGSPYVDAVADPAFRAKYVAASGLAARRFATRYPGLRFDWYITYESNLNDMYYSSVRSSYADLLTRLTAALSAIRPGRTFMWSPAFWYPYSVYRVNGAGMAQLQHALASLFTTLTAHRVKVAIDLQDFVSGSACQPESNRMTARDAASWVRYLSAVPGAPPVVLNVEQYVTDCATGAMAPAPSAELARRLTVYRSEGIPLGPAFELRYWATRTA